MRRTIILYGLSMAALVLMLKLIEYRYLMRDLELELYLGIVATFFAVLGVWAGRKLQPAGQTASVVISAGEDAFEKLGISKREQEVLVLMAQGHTNQEIADKLFVSLNTVKTHSSNLFLKLGVSRRTQAILKAREWKLIS